MLCGDCLVFLFFVVGCFVGCVFDYELYFVLVVGVEVVDCVDHVLVDVMWFFVWRFFLLSVWLVEVSGWS